MKTLKEYIEESILDVDDLVADDSILIKQWIQKNCRVIDKYTIKDNVVNVDGDVILGIHVKEIPIQFGEVTGSFQCMSTLMTNLKGSPRKCGAFYCNYCSYLTSLEGAPEECNTFMCDYCNELTTLKGLPKKLKGLSCKYCKGLKEFGVDMGAEMDYIMADHSGLTTLKGMPKKINGRVDISDCWGLTSLEGAPEVVGKNSRYNSPFIAHRCSSLISLEGAPKRVSGDFICYECDNLTSLKGAPKHVSGDFIVSKNRNLIELPREQFKKQFQITCKGKVRIDTYFLQDEYNN